MSVAGFHEPFTERETSLHERDREAPPGRKPRGERLKELTCRDCGVDFEVPRSRGHYPQRCPPCARVHLLA